jgi:iron uptake system component EfeO
MWHAVRDLRAPVGMRVAASDRSAAQPATPRQRVMSASAATVATSLAACLTALLPAAKRFPVATVTATLLAVGSLSGCSGGPVGSVGNVITITATACGADWQHPTAGVQTLQIHNAAASAVEVTLVNAYNGAIYAKVEGVGPGTTRAMPVNVGSDAYAFDCDGSTYGNRTGPTIRVPGHVRGGVAILPLSQTAMSTATTEEEAYVSGGLATVARQTAVLAAEIKAGDLSAARITWLSAHMAWERLGSAYGMFGPYDDEIDGTPFGLPLGVNDPGFTGFYRLEYGLWHSQSATELTGPAETLNLDVRSLETAYPGMELLPPLAISDLALRTHEVLENAMQQQLSGQDNFGSGTTLATLAAGIDATRTQLSFLHPLLIGRYQNLPSLDNWLDRLQGLVDVEKVSRGWTPVASLNTEQQEMLDAAAGETVQLLALIPPLFEADPNS